MACECGCNSCDRLLSGLSGSLMSGAVAVGSRVKVGFELSLLSVYDRNIAGNAIQRCLLDSGGLESVLVQFSESGILSHEYLTVTATPTLGFAKPEDFGSLVEGIVDSCGGNVAVSRRDPVKVISIPDGFEGDPAVEQVSGDDDYQGAGGESGIDKFFNSIAGDLGTSANLIKVGAIALGAFFILKLVKD